MDSNIIDELFQRINDLESQLSLKDQQISELQSKILQFQNPVQQPEPKKPSLLKAFVTSKLKFVSSVMRNGEVKIEFPRSLLQVPAEDPVLTRTMTTNSYIAQMISEIDQIAERKKKIEEGIESKKKEILERAEKEIEHVSDSFAEPLGRCGEETSNILKTILEEVKGSLVIENSSEKLFVFDDINQETLQVSLSQLKDSNGLALKDQKVINFSIFDFNKYRVLMKTENDYLLNTLSQHVMNIHYQLIEVEDNEKICCPVNITPANLSLQDYEIKFNKNQSEISEVVNKQDGPIKFATFIVSEDCGLLQTSMIEVFTSEISSHILNILHIHVDDMKDEIPLEAVYMLPDQDSSEYQDWTQDALGRNLRYKVLVKNGQVDSILYNTGSTTEKINFIERKLETGQFLAYRDSVVQVLSIPTGLLTRDWLGSKSSCDQVFPSKPAEGSCVSRYVEDLPGYVDIKIFLENGQLLTDPKEISVPVCFLASLTEREQAEVDLIMQKAKQEKIGATESVLQKIESMVQAFSAGQIKSNREFLNELSETVRQAKDLLSQDPGLGSKYAVVVQQSERVIRNIALDLRFSNS